MFTSNEYGTYYVVDKGMWTGGNELIVLATDKKDVFMSWSIVSVKIRKEKYVHESIKRIADKELATKYFKHLIGILPNHYTKEMIRTINLAQPGWNSL